ncbi:MAG: ATP-binding protein, partial [Alphaproteobacteria bacterium]|nr:ATP-binding protein [Alphaproteobacteria bacterium]
MKNLKASLVRIDAQPSDGATGTVAPGDFKFAHVVSIEGGQAIAAFDMRARLGGMVEERVVIGATVSIETPKSSVIGVVTGLSVPTAELEQDQPVLRLFEVDLVGEVRTDKVTGEKRFHRGVTTLPTLGDPVGLTGADSLAAVYSSQGRPSIEIGTLAQDNNVSASVLVDELLSKHFAIVGSTGAGKSCGIAGLLHGLVNKYQGSRILVLDIHNEYAAAFNGVAEVIHPGNLYLPFWLLSFDELASVFMTSDSPDPEDMEILHDAVMFSKKRAGENRAPRPGGQLRRATDAPTTTIDSPTPFRLADISAYIEEQMGKLERTRSTIALRRIRARIETLMSDPRYAFMFGGLVVQDRLTEIIGRLFRIPTAGRPITILDLSAVPSEILNVVISVICRLAFDLGVWSKGQYPMTLICEEAHRYVPLDKSLGFEPTRQAITRIAKEGRKYGISLGVVTQRPAEIDPTLLSQCSTVFAYRLSNDADQQAVRARSA